MRVEGEQFVIVNVHFLYIIKVDILISISKSSLLEVEMLEFQYIYPLLRLDLGTLKIGCIRVSVFLCLHIAAC